MEALILLAAPIVVSGATELFKKLKTVELSTNKTSILRIFAFTLSFGGVVAGAVATGQEIPVTEIEAYVEALLVFTATQVPYVLGKISGEKQA